MEFNKIYQNRSFNIVLSSVAVFILLMSSLHFWPFSSSKLWQYAVPFNSLPLLFGGIIIAIAVYKRGKVKIEIPPSIIFFVVICALSLIITPDIKRSSFYTIKIFGGLIGLYLLLFGILSKTDNLRPIIFAIIASCFIAVVSCIFFRLFYADNVFGFHRNAYKYSTYVSVFSAFSISYLVLQKKNSIQLAGYMLVSLTILSAGTIGLISSTILSLTVMALVTLCLCEAGRRKAIFLKYFICIVICFVCLAAKSEKFLPIHDSTLDDGQLAPLKQRYIEWQAEINILKDRIVTGCGAGAINTYRSEYYGQLPKLNTLQPFDQNGYLATAAELGLLGLVTLVWILRDYFKKIIINLLSYSTDKDLMMSCLCGLIAASIANIFSSFFYNGVLIAVVSIFVLVDYMALNKGQEG